MTGGERTMWQKIRLLISFLAALLLLGLAVPKLPIYGGNLEFGYSIIWIGFCLLVIGANLHALMRLGRGETIDKPRLNKEQVEAIKRIQRYKPRRMPSR